jgi:hypothetical protein
MKLNIVNIEECLDYEQNAARRGYRFACQCGEMHSSRASAETCRKCRTYLADSPTEVTEIIL